MTNLLVERGTNDAGAGGGNRFAIAPVVDLASNLDGERTSFVCCLASRITREAPDLYFDLNSHVLRTREQRKLAQIEPAFQDMLRDFPVLTIGIEGHSDGAFISELRRHSQTPEQGSNYV